MKQAKMLLSTSQTLEYPTGQSLISIATRLKHHPAGIINLHVGPDRAAYRPFRSMGPFFLLELVSQVEKQEYASVLAQADEDLYSVIYGWPLSKTC
jgi:hypothetical protein